MYAQNAFADRLESNFDYFSLFVVDLMHEFELGVWKAVFIHLIRMLVALGGIGIQEFNLRLVLLFLLMLSTVSNIAQVPSDRDFWAVHNSPFQ